MLLAGCAATHGSNESAAPEGLALLAVEEVQDGVEVFQPSGPPEQQPDLEAFQPATVTEAPPDSAASESPRTGRDEILLKVPICPASAEVPRLEAPQPSSLSELQAVLEAFLSEQCGNYGIYLIDLKTGAEAGVLSDHLFPTASTYKLPMVMYILDEVAHGRASLDEEITYTEEDWVDGAGLLKRDVKEGDAVKVRQLVELSIQESDNIAAEMLRRRFRSEAMFNYLRNLGGSQFYYDPESYGTTPREMAGYLAALYRGEGIADPALVEYLLNLLTHTAWNDRIDAGVPDAVPVAHKVGTWEGVINDAALVLLPERPYVLVFYSEGVQWDDALAISADVSRFVYEFFAAEGN